ncbi:MAG: alpha/beta hydrolase-fold protein [Bacteroidota bacterium]
MKLLAYMLLTYLSVGPIRAQHGLSSVPKVDYGRIERHENIPSRYISKRTVDVWLPNGYKPTKKYAVLYMHDGQMLFDASITWNKQAWDVETVVQGLMDSSLIKQTIVVGIHNISKERHSDYFPQRPFEGLPAKTKDSILNLGREEMRLFSKPIQSNEYLKFIVEELIPFVNENYSTHVDPENTIIGGSSMGGLISWYAICEYPEVFGGAACLSTHWPGIFTVKDNPIPDAFKEYLKSNLPDPKNHKIYFDYGTATLDALYPPLQEKIDEIMVLNGYAGRSWKSLRFEGEDHSEKAWSKRLHEPLKFLLSEE